MNLVSKAIEFSYRKHATQTRKGTGLPYIVHLVGVATLIKIFKTSKNLEPIVCAAYLHDTLEDTETSFEELTQEFGPMVASLVYELTNNREKIKELGKTKYLKKKLLGLSSYGLTIKLCDRLHNVSDCPTEQTIKETRDVLKFLKKNRKLSKTQKAIVNAIEKNLRS